MTTDAEARARSACADRFGEPALVVRSPGRVNLIGEHTDYNLGFVLPGAVDRAIWLALRPRNDRRCRFYSVDRDESRDVDLGALDAGVGGWAAYLEGVLAQMAQDGHRLRGVDCAFGGNVPIGSGMSSSAALECGFAFGLNQLFELGYDRVGLAKVGQRAENDFVGVQCGIMDQFASVLGQDGALLRLDCRDLSFAYVPFDWPQVCIVLCDTQVRHTLAGGEYNVRRRQCESGVAVVQRRFEQVRSLRDVDVAMIEACTGELDPVVRRRCLYVVQENARVQQVCGALASGDLASVGMLMNASHVGLRDDYEVSCRELDILAAAAQELPGVLGSRMMGGGFGGCTINLVQEDALSAFEKAMRAVFVGELHKEPLIHVCRLGGGTECVD